MLRQMNTNDEILVFEDANGNELKVDTANWKLRKGTTNMTINELADYLEKCISNDNDIYEQSAKMLRQQQAEIEALKAQLSKYNKPYPKYGVIEC
jgi:3-isopropylmalate dehydratase small subunit